MAGTGKKAERSKSQRQSQDAASNLDATKGATSKTKEESKGMNKDPIDTSTDTKVEQPTQIKSLATQAPLEDTIPPLSAGSSVGKSRIGHVRSESSDQNERGTSESSDDEDSRKIEPL